MNLILLSAADWVDATRVCLGGRRYDHLIRVLKAEVGDCFRVGERNGKIGTATVEAVDHDAKSITLCVVLADNPPLPSPITLILAMPRPLVFRRTLGSVITLGVKTIVIVSTARVEKSYFHTPLLAPKKIDEICVEALEQAVDTRIPEIRVHTRWRDFVRDEVKLVTAAGGQKWIAHPQSFAPCSDLSSQEAGKKAATLLAIGPEGGFVDSEVLQFEAWGFRRLDLGSRILRVETAVCAAITALTVSR